MPQLPGRRWLRRSDGAELLEWFLVAGIVSVLGIRAFLAATGYPKVGTGTLHIAHMLWGGALMLVALLLFFLFLDRPVHRVAAIVAGLGFGTFVDEIGKFVTADNDYFFRPAVALIYLIFVALFIVYRAAADTSRLSRPEALANALDVLEPGVAGPLEPDARAAASRLLDHADPDDPLAAALRAWMASRPAGRDEWTWLERLADGGRAVYAAAVENALFERALLAIVVIDAVVAVVGSIWLVLATPGETSAQVGLVAGVGQAASSVAGAILVARGIPELGGSRGGAYRWFRRGVLVWILVTQPFVFYVSQLAGLAGLAVDVVAYAVLTYMLGLEAERAVKPAG